MILTLACLQLGMTPAEAIVAATINAACAVGVGDDRGAGRLGCSQHDLLNLLDVVQDSGIAVV